jgi:hypothetical protein
MLKYFEPHMILFSPDIFLPWILPFDLINLIIITSYDLLNHCSALPCHTVWLNFISTKYETFPAPSKLYLPAKDSRFNQQSDGMVVKKQTFSSKINVVE